MFSGYNSEVGLRDQKKAATRQQISAVATRLFLQRGFDAVSVADVARAANALPAAQALTVDVYRHAIANIFGAGALIVLAGLIALLFLPELPLAGHTAKAER